MKRFILVFACSVLMAGILESWAWSALRVEQDSYQDGTYSYWGDNAYAGSEYNYADPGVVGATIAGGGYSYQCLNFTCSGSLFNRIMSHHGTICGGAYNYAGTYNVDQTLGQYASILGGFDNRAYGAYSAIPGGKSNRATGNYSFAAGCSARATGTGSFVWADGNCDMADFPVETANQFYVRASGGVYFRTNPTGGGATGLALAAGGSSWQNLSDRDSKDNFMPVNSKEILSKIEKMPIQTWNLKSQDKSIRHIGPIAQDFHRFFEFGEDKKYVNSGDMDGISLAAIQGLYQVIKEKDEEIQVLKKMMLEISRRLAAVEGDSRTVASK